MTTQHSNQAGPTQAEALSYVGKRQVFYDVCLVQLITWWTGVLAVTVGARQSNKPKIVFQCANRTTDLLSHLRPREATFQHTLELFLRRLLWAIIPGPIRLPFTAIPMKDCGHALPLIGDRCADLTNEPCDVRTVSHPKMHDRFLWRLPGRCVHLDASDAKHGQHPDGIINDCAFSVGKLDIAASVVRPVPNADMPFPIKQRPEPSLGIRHVIKNTLHNRCAPLYHSSTLSTDTSISGPNDTYGHSLRVRKT